MRVNVRVVAGAGREAVVPQTDGLKVYVRAPALEGRANAAAVEALAAHFGVAASRVRIVRGERSRQKVVEVVTGAVTEDRR